MTRSGSHDAEDSTRVVMYVTKDGISPDEAHRIKGIENESVSDKHGGSLKEYVAQHTVATSTGGKKMNTAELQGRAC